MNTEAVYQALITQLQTVPDLPPLQLENAVMQAKGPFARATTIRSRPGTLTVGVTGKDLHAHLLQVDLFNRLNEGTETSSALADAVIEAFPRGLELTADDVTIHVRKAFRETSARLNDQLHNTPVVIEYVIIA